MTSPRAILDQGVAIIGPLLRSHGFEFVAGEQGRGSGGRFARGQFLRGDRFLELHVRRGLGLVRYPVGDLSLSHDEYMRAASGEKGEYPGYSSYPLDGFRHFCFSISSATATSFFQGAIKTSASYIHV